MRQDIPPLQADHPSILRDKALNLREAVNSSRARMNAQAESLRRLRADVAELKALAAKPFPVPAVESRSTIPVLRMPAAAVPARAPEAAPIPSFKDRVLQGRNAPYALIFLTAVGLQLRPLPGRATAPAPAAALATPAPPLPAEPSSPEVAADDDGAAEALLLAHEWRIPGDDRPLAERLDSGTTPPGAQPEWTAEPTGERVYRVSFRPARSDSGYEFDVDLAARSVDPTPDTAELIAPLLASAR